MGELAVHRYRDEDGILRTKRERPRIYWREDRVEYPYRNERGRLLFVKVRLKTDAPPPHNKTFRYAYPEPEHMHGTDWIWKKPDNADRYLYRLPELLAAKANGDDIWWTEGEKDADAVAAVGVCATSHHQAAGHASPEQAEWFRGHTGRVILALDLDPDDPFGGNAGAHCVIKRFDMLRALGLKRIAVVHAKEGKDIADHLAAGLALKAVGAVTDPTDLRTKADKTHRAGAAWAGYDDPQAAEQIAEVVHLIEEGRNNKTGWWSR